MTKEFEISYKQELLRKSIHMISLSIPVTYSFITKEFALCLLIPLAIISIIIDFASRKKSKFRNFFKKIFGKMLRPHEYYDVFTFNGATWVLISAVICVLVFPKLLMIVGFTILIVSDICAALIGRRYGRHPLFVNKSWEGTTAFWMSAFIVIIILGLILSAPWTFYLFGFIAAIIGGFAEAASTMLKVDDNLSIPISISFAMWGGALISDYYLNAPFLDLLI
ncbi:diacylglycerol/polyprenol kinase family protein [Bacteroidota bacterium]